MTWLSTSFGTLTGAASDLIAGISGVVNVLTPAVELGLGLAGAFGVIPTPSPARAGAPAMPGSSGRGVPGVSPAAAGVITPAAPGLFVQAGGGGVMAGIDRRLDELGIPGPSLGEFFGQPSGQPSGGSLMPFHPTTTMGGGEGEGTVLRASTSIVPLPVRNRFTGQIVSFRMPRIVNAPSLTNPNIIETYIKAPRIKWRVTGTTASARHHVHRPR